jgi:hypothetical protein
MSYWIPVRSNKLPEHGQHVLARTNAGREVLVTFNCYRLRTLEVSIWTTETGQRVEVIEWRPIPPDQILSSPIHLTRLYNVT